MNNTYLFGNINQPLYKIMQRFPILIIIIIILFIERHIQRAVRGAVQHSKAGVKRNN